MSRKPEFDIDIELFDHDVDEVRIHIKRSDTNQDIDFCLSGADAQKLAVKLLGHAKRVQDQV